MKLAYFADTDSLYIDLFDRPSVDSIVITDDFIVDIDDQGNPVGLEIQYASQRVDLEILEAIDLPLKARRAKPPLVAGSKKR